jgi:hypothetical protein
MEKATHLYRLFYFPKWTEDGDEKRRHCLRHNRRKENDEDDDTDEYFELVMTGFFSGLEVHLRFG